MNRKLSPTLSYVFLKTIPVMVGYLFLGTAYGILMKINGFGLAWVLVSSVFIYAGSLQYLEVTLLAGLVNPLYAFFMGLVLNARHLFYGISMLGKFQNIKKWKPYLIFALTDETFSVLCGEDMPKNSEKERIYLWVSLLDQIYWVVGTVFGCLIGGMITFNTQGLDFALTALFVVIFTDQWKNRKDHRPALTGVLISAACVALFGADSFIIPAMLLILLCLTWNYRHSGNADGEAKDR